MLLLNLAKCCSSHYTTPKGTKFHKKQKSVIAVAKVDMQVINASLIQNQ